MGAPLLYCESASTCFRIPYPCRPPDESARRMCSTAGVSGACAVLSSPCFHTVSIADKCQTYLRVKRCRFGKASDNLLPHCSPAVHNDQSHVWLAALAASQHQVSSLKSIARNCSR